MVDLVRRKLDPQQHAIIRAHVTLCRDEELTLRKSVSERLAGLGDISLTMQFGDPELLADGCILMLTTDEVDQHHQMRQSILGTSVRDHGTPITMLYPRQKNERLANEFGASS